MLINQATSPLDLAQTLILVPNHRAILSLKNIFLKRVPEESLLLPKIVSLNDLGDHNPLGIMPIDNLPKKVDSCKRLGVLSQLILKFPGYKSTPQALKAAQLLGTILDEIQRWGLDVEKMETVVSTDYAEHWQLSLEFLKIVTHQWPSILQEEGVIDGQTRTHQALETVSAYWTQHRPAHRVVIAGSIGATPGIATLMKTVLTLPQGQVFLYGLDSSDLSYSLPHPQHALQKLLGFVGLSSSDICFTRPTTPLSIDRHQLVHTSTGNQDLTVTTSPNHWPQMIACSNLQQEAKVIALIMRQAIDTTTGHIVLVTPNQSLGHWVEQELARWDLTANQSDGLKLAETPPARFMLSVANYLQNPTTGGLLSILKHPFCAKANNRQTHLETIRSLEIKVIRRQGFEFETLKQSSEYISEYLDILCFPNTATDLNAFLNHHIAICEKLTGDTDDACPLWQQADGIALKDFLNNLKNQASHFPPISTQTYAGVFRTLLDQAEGLHNTKGIGSRLSIVGTFESRLSEAEVMILGGLNEDSWPQAPQENPWLNRAMRQQMGLPLPEWYIGLSAHDFWSCFYAPQLFLTRSLEENGTPTLASRWWQRLEAVYVKNQQHLATAPNMPWQEWTNQLIVSESIDLLPPAPCPPVDARPKCLYVTEVERLMRDPYAVYAKHCLGLKPLPSLVEDSLALKRGQLIHTVLDQYIKEHGGLDPDLDQLLNFAYPYFQKNHTSRTFWWQRFQKIGAWVVNELQNAPALQRLSEHKGHASLTVGQHTVDIKAIADRIDLMESHVSVIDYKTGGVPSLRDMKQGLSPQLGLEAWMAHRQGFSLLSNGPIKAALWHLTGQNPAGRMIHLEVTEEFLDETEKGLYNLFNTFLNEQTPYLACPNPENAPSYNDYSHLERLKEWQG